MNNSISGLAFSEDRCSIVAIELLGRKVGRLSLEDSVSGTLQSDAPWSENPASIMSTAVASGMAPAAAGRLVWINAGIWRVAADTLLVRQDSITPDRSRVFRYRMIAGERSASTRATDVQVWNVHSDTMVFSRVDDEAQIEIGKASVRVLLDPLRTALRTSSTGH
jgi:hypothetical protein